MKTLLIYPDDVVEEFKDVPGKKWRPSNGEEGDLLIEGLCLHCSRYEKYNGCEILSRTFWYLENDPKYPHELQIGPDGQPCCTAWEAAK